MKKKYKKSVLSLISVLSLLLALPILSVLLSSGALAREPVKAPDKADGVTFSIDDASEEASASRAGQAEQYSTVIMIYMVGSNLESKNALGTKDIHEIIDALNKVPQDGDRDEVRIILQTGGSGEWAPDFGIKADLLQRYEIKRDGLVLREELPSSSMAKPQTLSDFLTWGFESYKAERYGLILWNHGGGTEMGFGADELFPGPMMRLPQLKGAFQKSCKQSGRHFSFIGFDACLMGSLEIARTLSPYADYMIASEEMEPGNGWYYTNWIRTLLSNPDAPVKTLGKEIINDFAKSCEASGDLYTLSLLDLGKIDALYQALLNFMKSSGKALEDQQYSRLSKARSEAKSFGEGHYDQVDILDIVEKTSAEKENKELSKALSDVLVYFKSNIKNANGLAMYYPWDYIGKYSQMLLSLKSLGFDDTYTDYLSAFCTAMSQSDEQTQEGKGYALEKWYRPDIAKLYSEEADTAIPELLPFTEKDGQYIIDLQPKDWDILTYVGMEVWMDTGTNYIELGVEHWSEHTKEKDIVATFDGIWITLNGVFVTFYMQDMGMMTDDTAYEYGYVPAILNDDEQIAIRIELLAYPDGTGSARACGYLPINELSLEGDDSLRNLRQFQTGDQISFRVDVYDYDGEFILTNVLNDTIEVSENGIEVGYSLLKGVDTCICFYLEDVYKNIYYTEWMRVEDPSKQG